MKIGNSYNVTTNNIIISSRIITLIMALIALNFLYLATIKHKFFKDLALKQHQTIISIAPERAFIYDRKNKIVAFSQNSYSAFITPKNIKEKKELLKFLKKNFPKIYNNFEQYKNKHFMYIKRHLEEHELELIKKINLEDIHLLEEPKRCYPYNSLIPILGLTDIDNIGISGLEYFYNSQLIGENSTFLLQKDGHTKNYYKKEIQVNKSPTPLNLTIDAELQELILEELKETVNFWQAKEGAITILNPEDGEILAMVSYPSINYIDNNNNNLNIEGTKNRCLTQPYEAGSVIKTFLALAALEEKIVEPDEIIDCENTETTLINGMVVNTPHADGKITFSKVIQASNNIGVVKVALRLDKKLYDYYDKLGFGKNCTKEKIGEESSILYPPCKWSKRSIISLSFGYEMTTHLLQLTRAYALIANGGYLITPHIFKNINYEKSESPIFSKKSIDAINDILLKTVNDGTAKRAQIKGYTIKAKTGSAYCAKNGGYDQNASIYTCIAIIEKGDYKRVIGAFIKEPVSPKKTYASKVVVPVIEKSIERLLIHDRQIN